MRYREDSEVLGVFIDPGVRTPARWSLGTGVTPLRGGSGPPPSPAPRWEQGAKAPGQQPGCTNGSAHRQDRSRRTPDSPAENQAANPTGKPFTRVLSGCASACACPPGLLPARGSILVSLSDHWKSRSFKVLRIPFTLPGIPI